MGMNPKQRNPWLDPDKSSPSLYIYIYIYKEREREN